MKRVTLIGGPLDGMRVRLKATPPTVAVGEHRYHQVTDPDTGAFLGGYVWVRPPRPPEFTISNPPTDTLPVLCRLRGHTYRRSGPFPMGGWSRTACPRCRHLNIPTPKSEAPQ